MKLNIKAFAFTCAIVWGAALFMATWWIILLDGASDGPTLIGSLYRGYSVTPVGSFIGLGWALVDGLFGGAIFAWLYNWFASRAMSKNSNSES